MTKKVFVAAMLLLICFATKAWAYDFSAKCESGQTFFYDITSSTKPYTVEITKMEDERNEDDYYSSNSNLRAITIPSTVTHNGIAYSVTSIGDNAFEYCWRLTSVTIPNSVTRIGKEAFKSCESLTKIVISNYVTSIGVGAFWGCSSLTSMSVGKNNPNYDSRNNCNAIIETATNTLIYGCRNTTIPNSVAGIGTYAFASCKELITMAIPNSVKSIGNGAFAYSEITSINIPNSVTSIGDEAFAECNGLTSVTIPNSVTSIGEGAFASCENLTSINIPNSVTSIGDGAFSYSGLSSIAIPNSVTIIGSKTFEDCYILESITIPESITRINDSAFNGCVRLKSVVIPSSVKSIGTNVFSSCDSIANITLKCDIDVSDADLHIIKDGIKYAVQDKKSVKVMPVFGYEYIRTVDPDSDPDFPDFYVQEVLVKKCPENTITTIPETINASDIFTVTSIAPDAFGDCQEQVSVIIPNTVTEIGENAFSGVRNIVYDGSATGSPWGAKMINGYVDGFLLYSDETKITLIGCSSFATEVIIPNSVTSIEDYAFYGCRDLKSITLPSSLTSIGTEAFRMCYGLNDIYYTGNIAQWCGITFNDQPMRYARNLYINNRIITDLVIPEGITEIKNNAFRGVVSLTSVKIPNSVTSIGGAAFEHCGSLTSIKIPNSVKSIGYAAFWGCGGLTSITIPKSVTSIADGAFYECGGLTSITIPKSVTSIGDGAFAECEKLDSKTVEKIMKINPDAFKLE